VTDAEIIAEGSAYGTWLNPDNESKTGRVNTAGGYESNSQWPRRIAVVGGTKFDEDELENWLKAVRVKYPSVTIVTGSSRGAETFVRESAASLGFAVEVPEIPSAPVRRPLTSRKAILESLDQVWAVNDPKVSTDWQVTDILRGSDVVVIVGSPNGARAKLATAIHKRVDSVMGDRARPLVNVAVVKKAKEPV
jgi:hypothetical protein